MPNTCNFAARLVVVDSVDESVWAENQFADQVIAVFGNDATYLREFLQAIGLGDQFVPE